MTQSPSKSRGFRVLQLGIALLLCMWPKTTAQGQGARVLDDLIRGVVRVPKEVPIRNAEQAVKDIEKSRIARKAIDAEIQGVERTIGESGALRTISRADAILQLLRKTATHLDPGVVKRLEQLDEGAREAALVLARGGEQIERTIPDIAGRARFLSEGGADTVAAVGALGQDAAREALRLNEAIRGGSLTVRDADRVVSLADFGRIMSKDGEASWTFWKTYVRPRWKAWLATGALTAYLASPESFQDAAGGLTEAGFQRLTELAGAATAGAIRGVGRGAGRAAEDVQKAFHETYFSGPLAPYTIVGTFVFLLILALMFRRFRHFLMGPFRWLQRVPQS